MSNPNVLPSEAAAVLGVVKPDATAAGTVTSGWIDMSKWEAILAIVSVGDMTATGTVDAKLQQATDASGTGVKDVTGKAITQLTAAGTDSNKQALINCRGEELDINNNFTHVRLSVTVATAASDLAGLVLGFYPKYGPANANDATTVDEIVV